ncbi:MAG: N-acetylglutaminylglutamine synthetase [Polyangiaceae bacterium]|nr:N-acetylglutaminylglutamine synthetase [Polyangiaceae bacterium]
MSSTSVELRITQRHRLDRECAASVKTWRHGTHGKSRTNTVVDCGWGRLIFGHTFADNEAIAQAILQERPGKRDIAFYLSDPHVVLALAPRDLFLDPSHTYRLYLEQYRQRPERLPFTVRKLQTRGDSVAMSEIYQRRRMVAPDPAFVWSMRKNRVMTYLVAEDASDCRVIGVALGIDHVEAFEDPENGASLWALAVDPRARHPGVGRALVTHLAEHYIARGRSLLDLSVMHDNQLAIALYEKLGFQRIPVFAVKHKNPINEPLFVGDVPEASLNPYAEIIVREARRRGIRVHVIDPEGGYFELTCGGRSVVCRESLTELTSAVAMSRCDDKRVTRRVLAGIGLAMPAQKVAGNAAENGEFLERFGRVVVKPVRGEQGRGVAVDVCTEEEMDQAIAAARGPGGEALIEEMVEGADLRIIVIGYKMVAAAVRRPAQVIGTGQHSIRQLIERQSRRRAAATGGESVIPIDHETERCIRAAGRGLDEILPDGVTLAVRRTANLHTGGTIHDVTTEIHPVLVEAAERAAEALKIPVVGLDLIVPALDQAEFWIIEANERPGLANHEPQPTAERFVDLLFPQSARPS